MSDRKKETPHADLTLVRPGTTPEEMKQMAIDLYRKITGKEPTAEDMASMGRRVVRMK